MITKSSIVSLILVFGGVTPALADEAPGKSATSEKAAATLETNLKLGLDAYAKTSTALADDKLDVAKKAAGEAQKAFSSAAKSEGDHVALAQSAANAASQLMAVANLEAARTTFQSFSEPVYQLVQAQKQLQGDLMVFQCPMVKGFNRWLQEGSTPHNPYMGQAMAKCGSRVRNQ